MLTWLIRGKLLCLGTIYRFMVKGKKNIHAKIPVNPQENERWKGLRGVWFLNFSVRGSACDSCREILPKEAIFSLSKELCCCRKHQVWWCVHRGSCATLDLQCGTSRDHPVPRGDGTLCCPQYLQPISNPSFLFGLEAL